MPTRSLPLPPSLLPASRRHFLHQSMALAGAGLWLSGCTTAMNNTPPRIADHPMHHTRMPLSGWLDWEDPKSGHVWRVWLQMPESPPPAEGYPALVVLDGNAIFPLAAQWARLQQTRPAYVRGEPSIIIGIGHPSDTLFDSAKRNRDYTPPAPGAKAPEGGAEHLLDFLEHVLLADWIERLPLNRSKMGLFGHSLSGLFVLHSLFTRPALFTDYYAASPSIWWNDAYLLQEQAAFTQQYAKRYAAVPTEANLADVAHANVFLYAGSLEEPSSEARPANAPTTGQRHTVRLQITRAREMAAELSALQWPSLKAQFHLWPDLTHGDTMMPSLMQAVTNTGMPKAWKDADYGLRNPEKGR
ncbi:alpha/beta hydrolase [Lampropedia puyangensis]|uniref:Alpha/beta hydrolase n=1 Tax=Lampropedia puyangensis TaxID=1330072 RepID=A0A4S8FD96_9BURK|nr:alpha/beta hydrolase-fold protein [Lampropedia puyangensis]THU04574.1 alpha/beta hydrolase [Lampropedia puyangensis]